MRVLMIAAALATLAPAPAIAQQGNTVQHLVTRCRSNDNFWYSWCLGYVLGVLDGLDTHAFATSSQSACGNTEPYTAEQVMRVFMNWAERYPEHWQQPAAMGVTAALVGAGMC